MNKPYDNNLYFPTPLQKMALGYANAPVYKFVLTENPRELKFISENSFRISLNEELYPKNIRQCLKDLEEKDLVLVSFLDFSFSFLSDGICEFWNTDNVARSSPLELVNFTPNTLKRILKKLHFDLVKIILNKKFFFKSIERHIFTYDNPLLIECRKKMSLQTARGIFDHFLKNSVEKKEMQIIISIQNKKDDEFRNYLATRTLLNPPQLIFTVNGKITMNYKTDIKSFN